MKYRLTLIAFLFFSAVASAQLQFVDVEPHMLSAPNSEQPEGTITYRVYANLLSPEDRVSAVFGTGCKPLDISTTTSFFNEENGGVTATSISVSAFELFPNLEADSWVTVGIDDAADEGAAGIGALSSVGTPFVDAFGTNPGASLELTDGSWFSSDSASSSGMGIENRVLIGQFTTDGDLSFHLNISVFVGGDQQNGRIDYVWNQECEGSIYEQDGSELGLIFTGMYCADPLACNFSEFAEGDNIDNSLCNYDACSGCTQPDFCNYSEYYTSDDGSCTNECGGCLDTEALNFDPNANVDDGSCLYLGCTNELALNFQEDAGQDDGSCEFEGCTDPEAVNYFLLATEDDGSCTFICASNELVFNMTSTLGVGWLNGYYIVTDEEGNFVASGSLALADETDESSFGIDLVCLLPGEYVVELYDVLQDGVMSLEIGCAEEGNILIEAPNVPTPFTVDGGVDCVLGCTDEAASNYNALANYNFGCVYLGCTDELAVNYDPLATEDDGSCILGISGYVFFDAEVTGEFVEETDNGVPNYAVHIAPVNRTIFTDENGYFEIFDLPEGSYSLSIQPNAAYPVITTSDSYTVEVNGTGIPQLFFGITNEESTDALQINNLSLNTGVPCGDTPDFLSFAVENTGTTILSGEVSLTFDPLYEGVDTALPEPVSEGTNTITFNFTEMAPGTSRTFMVSLLSPLAENSGATIVNSIEASAFADDVLVASSEKVIEEVVTCTALGNDKGATPLGYAEPHFVLHETNLEYVVQFQNTTDNVVENVVVRDTLDVSLDLNTFELVGQTHGLSATLDGETRELVVTFENIQLPTTAEALGSSGALSYRVLPLATAEAGTLIENTAFIAFDSTPSVSTSTVFHTLYTCGEEADFVVDNELCVGEEVIAEAAASYIDYWSWSWDEVFLNDEQTVTLETGASGTFALQLTAGNELCESSVTEEIGVFDLPNPQISQEGSELTCTPEGTYQWFLNGEPIEGATQNPYTITLEGTYTVEVTSIHGCVGLSDEFFATPVNVLEVDGLTMNFYPNPLTHAGVLELADGTWDIVLMDARGRILREERFVGSKWVLERGELAAGVYFLRVNGGSLRVVVK